ncbi:MAG: ribonuclease P protein component [Culturomica sp.]|jgi:ribonuclease P protein component|nr:ribonuclease P protein component [Culturomica sp.]
MNTFTKSERLCSKQLFEDLTGSDFAFVKYPFRVVAKRSAVLGEYPARIAVSVGKKRFKRAVKRNRVKRQTREAYRLSKEPFYHALPPGETWDILFIYLDRQLPEYTRIEKSVRASLHKILQHAAGGQAS